MNDAQCAAARFALAAMQADDAGPGEHPSDAPSEFMSLRVLSRDGRGDLTVGLNIACHGLDAIGEAIGLPPGAHRAPTAASLVKRLRRERKTGAALADALSAVAGVVDGLDPPSDWRITEKTMQKMAENAPPTPAHTTRAERRAPMQIDAPDVQRPRAPFRSASVADRMLEGTAPMVRRATGDAFKSMREVFDRLEAAEETAVTLYERIAHGPGRAPADEGEVTWTRDKARIGDLFPESCVVFKSDGPTGSQTDAEEDRESLRKLLNVDIDIWTPDRTVDAVPEIDERRLFDYGDLATVLSGIRLNRNVMITGATGCGKTTFVEQVAARLRRPFVRIPVDGELRRRELLGGWYQASGPTGSFTEWRDGLLTKAYASPSILTFDEYDKADPDFVHAAHEALEGRGLRIAEQPGRLIRRHPGCVLTATANTRGAGDPSGLYPVANHMSEASRNRFTYFIAADYLDAAAEARLLRATCPSISEPAAALICEIARDLRAQTKAGTIRTACSTRQVLDIAADILERERFERREITRMIAQSFRRIMVERAADPSDEAAIRGVVSTLITSPAAAARRQGRRA